MCVYACVYTSVNMKVTVISFLFGPQRTEKETVGTEDQKKNR